MKKSFVATIITCGIAAGLAGSSAVASADVAVVRPASYAVEQPTWGPLFCDLPRNWFLPECWEWHHRRHDGWYPGFGGFGHRDFDEHRGYGDPCGHDGRHRR